MNKRSYHSTPLYALCMWTGTTLYFHNFCPSCTGIYMFVLWLMVWFLPHIYCDVSFNLRHSVSIRTKYGLCFVTVILIQQNSISLTRMGPNSAKLLNIVDYRMVPSLTQVFTGNFLLLLLYLGCTTNQRSIAFWYLFRLLVKGHQGPLLCFLKFS